AQYNDDFFKMLAAKRLDAVLDERRRAIQRNGALWLVVNVAADPGAASCCKKYRFHFMTSRSAASTLSRSDSARLPMCPTRKTLSRSAPPLGVTTSPWSSFNLK